MRKLIRTLFIAISFYSSLAFSSKELQLNIPEGDSANDYYRELLRLAFTHGAKGRTVPHLNPIPYMQQERTLSQLQLGESVDITWAGGSTRWANKLRMVKVPLDRGLLGYRQFIINTAKLKEFNRVRSPLDLKQFTACQGIGWPDTVIMREAGFRVNEIADFEGIYKMVSSGRCDYFPRGYIEATSEMEKRSAQYPNLMIYKPLILYYPFAMFFYLNPKDEELAQWIEAGLERMIDDGTLLTNIKNRSSTKLSLLPNGTRPRFIELPNPLLPKEINIKDSRYWLQRNEFSEKTNKHQQQLK